MQTIFSNVAVTTTSRVAKGNDRNDQKVAKVAVERRGNTNHEVDAKERALARRTVQKINLKKKTVPLM